MKKKDYAGSTQNLETGSERRVGARSGKSVKRKSATMRFTGESRNGWVELSPMGVSPIQAILPPTVGILALIGLLSALQ
jgi:hypothetical protein